MQNTATLPAPRRLSIQASKPAFSVAAIHDGFFANVRALEALEWLNFTLRPDFRVCPASWSFDKLESLHERNKSVRAAAAADLLIVSAADEAPLPEHIKQWFDLIPKQQRVTRPILVALHAEDFEFNSAQGFLCSHLKAVADSWKTEFMCNAEFDQRLDCDFATQLISSKGMLPVHRSKPFGGEFTSAPRYWGING